MKSLDINEVTNIRDANIIDVRETYEYEAGSVPGAKNIPMAGLMMNANNFLDKNKTYYIMCQAGGRSMQVCSALDDMGYDVINLTGGYGSYQK